MDQHTPPGPDKAQEKDPGKIRQNDTAGTGDDTLGENTEETPLTEEIKSGDDPGERITPSEELD